MLSTVFAACRFLVTFFSVPIKTRWLFAELDYLISCNDEEAIKVRSSILKVLFEHLLQRDDDESIIYKSRIMKVLHEHLLQRDDEGATSRICFLAQCSVDHLNRRTDELWLLLALATRRSTTPIMSSSQVMTLPVTMSRVSCQTRTFTTVNKR
jgi:hypothetical protein